MPVTPPHLIALDRANEVRIARAQTRRHLKTLPRPTAAQIAARLAQAPLPEFHAMPTGKFLRMIPRVGPAKVTGFLNMAGISPARPLGELTPRQRGEVLKWLTGMAGCEAVAA